MMKKSTWKKVVLGMLGLGLLLGSTGSALAEESGLIAFFKKLFKYPVKTTEKVVQTSGHAVENVGGVVEAAARHTGEIATGDIAKTPDLVAEPLQKTLEMSGQLVSETAGAPLQAAEEVQKEE